MTDRREYSVLGIPVMTDPNDGFANINTMKQGHKCCGGCCDMRRAVIIVNMAMISLFVIYLPFVVLSYNVINHPEKYSDDLDDNAKEAFANAQASESPLGFVIFLMIAKIACLSFGIYGALKFKLLPVAVSLASYGFAFIYAIFTANILMMLLPVFFAYPHIFFIKEVRQGIMSEDNYDLERHSCCCV